MMERNDTPGLAANLPLPLFASVMGLSGLALVWQTVERHWQLPALGSLPMTLLATALFILLAVGYGYKWLRHAERVRGELAHPVRINFLPTISISVILLGLLLHPWLPSLATGLWVAGAAAHLLLTIVIVTVWLETERPLPSINPAWFIPAVGNVLVPLAAAPAGATLTAWFFLAAGLFFWGILVALVFFRLITGPALEPPMRPTLSILLAPPSVAFLAWSAVTGESGTMGHLLYAIALLTALLLLPQIPGFFRLPFYPSWWAHTFPLAAFTVASFQFAAAEDLAIGALLALLATTTTVVIAAVAIRTLVAVWRGDDEFS